MGDVGFIPFILNCLFIILLVFNTIKLFRSNNRYAFYIGLGVLYFIIHSAKTSNLNFSQPYTIFIVFISTCVINIYCNKHYNESLK